MEKRFLIYNIKWDTDGDEKALKHLPVVVKYVADVNEDDDINNILSDYISDEYGFCHNGFDYLEINYDKPVKIQTQFGEITMESLNYDHHKPGCREEEDRIKVFDSDGNYFDHWSVELLFNPEKIYDGLIMGYLRDYMKDIWCFLECYCINYEFVGTKEEMISYLRDELSWENAEEVVTKEKRNEYINRIGDYYILIYQE